LKKRVLLFLMILMTIPRLFSNDAGIMFTIRYYDKRIYYPGSQIFLKIEITNNTSNTFRFKVADSRVFNMEFTIKTLSNTQLPASEEFIIHRNSIQHVFFREVSLEPGEQYSIIEELSRYVRITEPGVFIVEAQFYPELVSGRAQAVLRSNALTLSVRPEPVTAEVASRIDAETGQILQTLPIPPDEAVAYTLEARQKSQWNKFLLYIDVERLMLRDPAIARVYPRLSQAEKQKKIAEYARLLTEEMVDEAILVIPTDFEILKTSYTPDEATVQVTQRYAYTGFTEIKRFTYYLYRDDRVWYIYNYEVRNLGTE